MGKYCQEELQDLAPNTKEKSLRQSKEQGKLQYYPIQQNKKQREAKASLLFYFIFLRFFGIMNIVYERGVNIESFHKPK